MRLNKQTLIQVLEIAAEKGEAGFEEKDLFLYSMTTNTI